MQKIFTKLLFALSIYVSIIKLDSECYFFFGMGLVDGRWRWVCGACGRRCAVTIGATCHRSGAGAPSASGPAVSSGPRTVTHTQPQSQSHCTMLVTLLLVTGAAATLDTRTLDQERLLNLDIAQGVDTAAQKEISYKSAGGPHPASYIRHTLKLPTTLALPLWSILIIVK